MSKRLVLPTAQDIEVFSAALKQRKTYIPAVEATADYVYRMAVNNLRRMFGSKYDHRIAWRKSAPAQPISGQVKAWTGDKSAVGFVYVSNETPVVAFAHGTGARITDKGYRRGMLSPRKYRFFSEVIDRTADISAFMTTQIKAILEENG